MTELLFPNEPQLAMYADEWNVAGQTKPNLVLSPFTAKTLYAFGMMRHLMESAGWALNHNPPYHSFYISAFLLSSGAIELFGRIVSGDNNERGGATQRLKSGLKEIASIPQASLDDSEVVVVTNHKAYTVADCVALRNFCAHGGSVGRVVIDVELVDEILKKLSEAMDRHWLRLMTPSEDEARSNMANAAVAPLFVGPGPDAILVGDLYRHVKNGFSVSNQLMYREAWQTYK